MNKVFLYSIVALLAAAGCRRADEPQPIPEGKGALQMTLRIDAGLTSTAAKAAVEDTYPITAAELKVAVAKQDGTTVGTWDPMTTLPPVVYLEPGNYTLQINTRGNRQAVNATPYYFGQTPFVITAGRATSIYANASLKSLVVSMTLVGGWATMTDYKLGCYALENPEKILFQTTDRTARLYLDTPFRYGVKIEGRIGGNPKKTNVLVYDDLTVGTYHHLTLNDQ